MESIMFKALNESYTNDKDIKNMVNYIAGNCSGKEKTRYCNGRGLPKDSKKAANCIIKTQRYYGKGNRRRIYHFILSFPHYFDDANYVKLVAESIADMIYEKYQVYYGVHEDTDNLHIHFAVNAVSYVDGKKWHKSKGEFRQMKEEILERVEKIRKEFI